MSPMIETAYPDLATRANHRLADPDLSVRGHTTRVSENLRDMTLDVEIRHPSGVGVVAQADHCSLRTPFPLPELDQGWSWEVLTDRSRMGRRYDVYDVVLCHGHLGVDALRCGGSTDKQTLLFAVVLMAHHAGALPQQGARRDSNPRPAETQSAALTN